MRRDIQDDLITVAVNEPGVTGDVRVAGCPRKAAGASMLPWVSVTATGRREALDEARAAVAEWVEVQPDAFEVEAN